MLPNWRAVKGDNHKIGSDDFFGKILTYRRNTMTTIFTTSNEGTLTITTNDGRLDSASAVVVIEATNPEYNQPALRIRQAGKHGGAASIRIDDPNPDIELI